MQSGGGPRATPAHLRVPAIALSAATAASATSRSFPFSLSFSLSPPPAPLRPYGCALLTPLSGSPVASEKADSTIGRM